MRFGLWWVWLEVSFAVALGVVFVLPFSFLHLNQKKNYRLLQHP